MVYYKNSVVLHKVDEGKCLMLSYPSACLILDVDGHGEEKIGESEENVERRRGGRDDGG